MAEFHLHIKSHSRGVGKGAGGHARYVLREGPYASRTVEVVEGATVKRVRESRDEEVLYACSGNMPLWADDNPIKFWDAADERERANGTVYREVEIALPAELSAEENIRLARHFAKQISQSEKGQTPYTMAIHRSEKNPDLLHAHIMLSDRVFDGHDRTPETFFKRAAVKGKAPDMGGAPKCEERRAAPGHDWADRIRPLWSDLANCALERAGIEARIDHRSLDARRQEQERLAIEAKERGDEVGAARHRKIADELDRPAQPKRGRALDHGGPEAAPDRARRWEAYLVDLDERRAAVERSRNAETEAARIKRAVAIHERAILRQGYRMDPWEIRERWHFRQYQRELDRLAIVEQRDQAEEERAQEAIQKSRNGQEVALLLSDARPRKKTPWRQWREKTLIERYGENVAAQAVREDWYIRMRPDLGGLNIVATMPSGKRIEIVDGGDVLRTEGYGSRDEIELMLDLAQAKGWTTLNINGNQEFRLAAAKAAIERGLGIADKDLEDRVIAIMEREQPSMPNEAAQAAIKQGQERVRSRKSGRRDPTDDWW
jgi:hypothetical protein